VIYFIQRGANGPIKIGRAVEPEVRLRSLQTGNSEPLRILLTIPGTAKREAEIHAALAESRISGEWYRPTQQVFAYMDRVRESEFEVQGHRAYAVLRRRDASSLTNPCPFCGEPHKHGEGDGHRARAPQCGKVVNAEVTTSGGITLRQVDGYIVRSHGSDGPQAV
jgi:hypothetical protein